MWAWEIKIPSKCVGRKNENEFLSDTVELVLGLLTYCSNMDKLGMNLKALQYLMGDSAISVILNTYTHVNFDDAKDELHRVANA